MNDRHATVDTAKDFGVRLRTARKGLRLTQDELASKAGLSTITLSKLESGVNKPSFDVVVSLCNAMNIEPNYFLGWQNKSSAIASSERKLKLQNLMIAVEQLDDAWIEQIIAISKLAISAKSK
ncbi:helix-turn-helix domain-containing protein [Brucella intermedia]|uniref:helix-turn-helix domain-containing protein n=1 Tax=Brucella intermedia TaxID=94625 RepID=UPI001BCFE779|nr:helix-turn-helix transcriptional regulator [Brucella intermedia]